MRIGLLNDIASMRLSYTSEDGKALVPKIEGDPLKGEQLLIRWQDLKEKSLLLSVDLGGRYFVNDLCLGLGADGAPHSVRVWDAAQKQLLCTHLAETGETLAPKTLTLCIGEELEGLVIEFGVYFASVDLRSLRLFGAESGELPVFPIPQQYQRWEGTLPVSVLGAYTADSEIAFGAMRVLAEKLQELTGVCTQPAESASWRLVTDSTVSANGYHLCVSGEGVVLSAADLRGFVYGGEVLLKLIQDDSLPYGEIKDAPFMPFRGVHLMLPGPEELELASRLIKHVVSPMGYNAVILEIAGGMRFDSHPEITEAVLDAKARAAAREWPAFPHASVGGMTSCIEKRDVAELADYIRSFGIDVIPEVQSLGHVQFMTLAHPEIAERDEKEEGFVDELAADIPPKRFYPHCYCPSNEKSYEILFDLMDEIIEVIKPTQYVHIGHDEVYQIGVCPICRDKDPAELFATDVQRIYDHLAAKGLKAMMWSDMLQPVTKYRTPAAIDRIPKDIVMLDFIWYFHMDKDIEDNLLPKGFPLAYGNLYSSHFPRFESRIAKDGVIGGQVSAWVGTNELALGKEGKIYDFMYTAQMLWAADYDSRLRLVYDRKLREMMPSVRNALRAQSPLTGEEITLWAKKLTLGCGESVQIPVSQKCAALIFMQHTESKLTRIPWGPLQQLGCCEVCYEDGETECIPVEYGGNIGHWARRQNEPLKGSFYRHNGYFCTYFTDGVEGRAKDGAPTTSYRFEWRNPTPEREIRAVRICVREDAETAITLCALSAKN